MGLRALWICEVGEIAVCETGREQLKMLAEENQRLRKAGANLSAAALRVCSEYDGLHRLALAVSEFAKAMGDEHGRGDSP